MKFLKKISVLLAGLTLVGIIAGCGAADSFVPKGYKKISADKVGYRLYVPDNWIDDLSTGVATAYVSEKDRSNISFMAFEVDDTIIQAEIGSGASGSERNEKSDSDGTTEAVTTQEPVDTEDSSSDVSESVTAADSAASVPDIKTVEDYWEYYSVDFQKTFPDMEYVVKGENMLLSGKAAERYVYTATVTGEKYQFMQVIMLNAGTVYIFTYTALPDNYDKHLEQVEEIIGYIDIDF